MSDDKKIIVDPGPYSAVGKALIEKAGAGFGGYFKAWQIGRVAKAEAKAIIVKAKAEAEADIIKAKGEIEITELYRRTLGRFFEEEVIRQENMEKITMKALPHLEDESDPSKMQDDWVTHFFDKSRIVSDDEMQEVWARVLAGEANLPGTYSKRTVNCLGDLDRRDAKIFAALCGFVWLFDDVTVVIFNTEDPVYNDNGVNIRTVDHLDSIGLIKYSDITGYCHKGLPKTVSGSYFGRPLNLTMEKEDGNVLRIGKVVLSQVGYELISVCQAKPVDGFFDYVKGKWSKYLPEDEGAEQGASADADKSAS
jgi:hypothetical protein